MIVASTTWAGTVCKRVYPFVPFQNRNFAVETVFRACPCSWSKMATVVEEQSNLTNLYANLTFEFWHLFLGQFIGKQKQACTCSNTKLFRERSLFCESVEAHRREELLIKGSMAGKKERYHK